MPLSEQPRTIKEEFMIIVGEAKKGGTLERQAKLVELACQDLEKKVGDGKITSISIDRDEQAVYAIGVVEGVADEKEDKSKKRGK